MDDNAEVENSESDGEFQFETDHLALRGNREYCDLLKYIVKLRVQKIKSLKDIDVLVEEKNKALEDPIKFVQNLQKGDVSFPSRQTIANLPQIDWNKYGLENFVENEDLRSQQSINTEFDNATLVRGRKFTDNKPETFNQLWSCDEQKRLEELLEIYPEEAIESRRYKKIAQALGTRTTVQVMSRIQKYFAKLAKAGLPIPGRLPKRIVKDKARLNVFYKKSTFFPQLHVPVKMEDPLDDAVESNENLFSNESCSANKAIELLKSAKEQRALDERSPIWQTKTMCVGCLKTGFVGARWTDNAGTDYCTDCVVRLLPEERLTPVRQV